jgi:hypothetical protein
MSEAHAVLRAAKSQAAMPRDMSDERRETGATAGQLFCWWPGADSIRRHPDYDPLITN